MNQFGTILREFRRNSVDQRRGGSLTQERFVAFLEQVSGISASNALLSYWESGKRKISAEDRVLLLAIVQVLRENGGIKTVDDADRLLRAGYYAGLSSAEMQQLGFDPPKQDQNDTPSQDDRSSGTQNTTNFHGNVSGPIHTGSGNIYMNSGRRNFGSPDPMDSYFVGIERLLDGMPPEDIVYTQVQVFQQRLTENVHSTRLYGDTATNRAERAQIIAQLNRIALESKGESFMELCR